MSIGVISINHRHEAIFSCRIIFVTFLASRINKSSANRRFITSEVNDYRRLGITYKILGALKLHTRYSNYKTHRFLSPWYHVNKPFTIYNRTFYMYYVRVLQLFLSFKTENHPLIPAQNLFFFFNFETNKSSTHLVFSESKLNTIHLFRKLKYAGAL